MFRAWPLGRVERQCAVIPSCPARARDELHAQAIEARKPGAQKGRGLHLLREDAAAGADESLLAEAVDPRDQIARCEGFENGLKVRLCFAVVPDEARELLNCRIGASAD